jgi:hypothetical protein
VIPCQYPSRVIDKFFDQEYSLLGTRNIGTNIAKLDNNGNPVLSRGLANNGFSYLSRGASQLLVIKGVNIESAMVWRFI